MTFQIREFDETKDTDNFYKNSFETLVTMKGIPPDMSRQDYYQIMVEIVKDYIKGLEKNKIFIAEDEHGTYLGHIWLSLKDELEIWEYNSYFWLQNITIVDDHRRKGIGTKLMIHAEHWIRNQGYNQIGLHVDGKNFNAINFYNKFQYSVFKTQLYKQINSQKKVNDPELNVSQCEADKDFDNIQNFLYVDLRERVDSSVDNEEINNRISVLLKDLRNNNEDQIYIISNYTDEILGYFILAEAEMKFKKIVYIKAFRMHKQVNYRKFIDLMLGFSEQWAMDNQIELIETVLTFSTPELLEYLKIIGFFEFGYFMIKNINN